MGVLHPANNMFTGIIEPAAGLKRWNTRLNVHFTVAARLQVNCRSISVMAIRRRSWSWPMIR